MDVLQVPTTVAAMVDAAVGGKTGINTSEGKNLVGAFHPSIAVVADLDVLAGLRRELRRRRHRGGGQGRDSSRTSAILEIVEEDPTAVLDVSTEAFREVVERKIRLKAHVVSGDLTESGKREILNSTVTPSLMRSSATSAICGGTAPR